MEVFCGPGIVFFFLLDHGRKEGKAIPSRKNNVVTVIFKFVQGSIASLTFQP